MRVSIEQFVPLAQLFRPILESNQRACGDVDRDPWASLRFFLLGYAYEHQGRAADYPAAAEDTVIEFSGDLLNSNVADRFWKRFSARLAEAGRNGQQALNFANNPLCPKGFKFRHRRKGSSYERATSKESVLEVLGSLGNRCITSRARDLIHNGEVLKAHTQLRRIGGIGPKIASLFLRDISTLYDLQPLPQDREYLQPVDIWIRRVVRNCAADNKFSDEKCRAYVITHCSDQPERANQGIWYFCARVASSSNYRVNECLQDSRQWQRAVERHLVDIENAAMAAANFVGR